MPTAAVVVFPGSNCDRDMFTVLAAAGFATQRVWHASATLPKVDLVALPGGFSYGDYLRSGAMAAHAPIMKEVVAHAARGGRVLGVCNGFQILTEAGLLPGTLLRNRKLTFLCREVCVRVERHDTPFTQRMQAGQVLAIPIAHHDGSYYASPEVLAELEARGQVAFRYCTARGEVVDSETANLNGSVANIAGVFNEARNVLGMMPHPERHAETLLGGVDGAALFASLAAA